MRRLSVAVCIGLLIVSALRLFAADSSITSLTPFDQIPTLYGSFLTPEPLTPRQRDDIAEFVKIAKIKETDVWFIYVRYGYAGHVRGQIYLKPTSHHGRVRRGKFWYFDTQITPEQRRFIAEKLGEPVEPPSTEYVQIAPSDVPPNTVPAEVDMPFPSPTDWKDDEILSITDAARTAVLAPSKVDERSVEVFEDPDAVRRMPIRSIEMKNGTDPLNPMVSVTVSFGWRAHGLAGRGVNATFRREKGNYVFYERTMWLS